MKKALRSQGIMDLKQHYDMMKEAKIAEEQSVRRRLFQSTFWQSAQVIGLTMSLPFEFDTTPIIQEAFETGKSVVLPVIKSKEEMVFVEVFPDTCYQLSSFGVKEPIDCDIIPANQIDKLIVPGILFNHEGYRIGFGGGYYDRFLSAYNGETASLVFSYQLGRAWQADSYDQPVSQLFTINNEE